MPHFTCGIHRVGIYNNQARPQRTEQCNRVLQYVRHHQSDTVTRFQAHVLQRSSEIPGQVIELGIGQFRAHAVIGHTVFVVLATLFQYVDN